MLAGTVRFTQPSGFNDPFELLPEVVMPLAEFELSGADAEALKAHRDIFDRLIVHRTHG